MMLESIPISVLAEVRSGGGAPQDPSAFTSTGHPFVRAGSLSKLLDGASEKTLEKLEPAKANEHGLDLFPAGTVLFAKSGMSATKGYVYRLRGAAYVVNHLAALIPRNPDDSAFLARALQRFSPTVLIKDPAYPSIRLGDIERMKLLAPRDLARRRRIAEILDKADALRAVRRAALAQLDTIAQSIFLDVFGDPRRNEKGWPMAPLGSVVTDVRGGAALEPDDFVDEGFPILHKGAIKPKGKISLDSKKKTFAPLEYANANKRSRVNRAFVAVTLRDLVPSGPSIGMVADLRKGPFEEYLLAQGAYAFRLVTEKIVPEYFVYLSNMPNFRHVLRQNAVGSTQIHIRTPIYLAISIPLPPVELQLEFACRMSAVEEGESAQLASLAELDRLFASLQHRAFRGEL